MIHTEFIKTWHFSATWHSIFSIVSTVSVCTAVLIVHFAACQKIVKPKLKLATPALVPSARQMLTPTARSHAQHVTAVVNGDVSRTPTSSVTSVSANSVVMVKCQLCT